MSLIERGEEAEAVGLPYVPSVEEPYRWRDWAAPFDDSLFSKTSPKDQHLQGWKRHELTKASIGQFFRFINGEYNEQTKRVEGLIPYLRRLKDRPGASPRRAASVGASATAMASAVRPMRR